ncbi:hypothetical protein CONLIGDRAFT_635895 [Coniochaeta ligniaria NRRL 30616]|uniref:Uncharacterized protein n=1 Tax=Coniochaeta ligniaria NRRL 30616 TaxID=1408157 RepID=A0A1J7IEM0_9PEZI|nr:hypothetical protein CONLIGDRAFT_635895 [Coniochaeta ligniaria NRRL 30616]
MKGRPVDQLVYEYMFPKPRPSDPQDFAVFLQRHLVLEVRQEVHSFYGHLETPEAKYPGLDYCHTTHRIRLSRWPWHRRLFRAFDGLRLTPNEIAGLTKWEGTKWAKERYEKEQGITILDTAADDISGGSEQQDFEQPGDGVDETMAEDSDEELESVAVDLNERLAERVALRTVSGDHSMALDEEWERWLKEAIETGRLPEIASRIYEAQEGTPSSPGGSMDPASLPRGMLTAARHGHWDDIPDSLHTVLRRVLERESNAMSSFVIPAALTRQRTNRTQSPASVNDASSESMASRARLLQPHRRRHLSDLRLPGREAGSPRPPWYFRGP